MSQNGKDGDAHLPSYSESMLHSTPLNPRSRSPARGQQILDQLTLVRAQHLRNVIDDHIIPLVEQQASFGIAQTTIAMLPSDIPLPPPTEKSEFSFDTGDEKKVEVIGFASEEEPRVVRLEGQMNRTEFWRPQAVIMELERVLRDSLNASPNLRSPATSRFGQYEPPQGQQRQGFFSRIVEAIGREERSGNPEVGTTQTEAGQVLVKARLEELCLRTITEFGLYDTMTKQCVIIRIDARC